ncbi:MAG: hypothetical protein Q9218_003726, partial [Villophora microphyllina]
MLLYSARYFVVALHALSTFADNPSSTRFCLDPMVNLDPACWDSLNLPGYLEQWWHENEKSCNEIPYQGDGFASCFQQKHGYRDTPSCNNITNFNCPGPSLVGNMSAQDYMILQSIYNIHAWYTTMWESAVAADLFADQLIGKIIDTIHPTLPGDTSLGVLLSALSAGFAFLGIPAGQAGSAGAQVASQVVATAIGQAPGLAKTLLPTGSLDSKLIQIHDVEAYLSQVTQQFQANLALTLNASVSDFSIFYNLTRGGAFVGTLPSLNLSTTQLTRIFKTFIVSQALQADNVIITVARNLTPYDLYHREEAQWGNQTVYKGEGPLSQILPVKIPNIRGTCTWWIDPKTNDSYALHKLDHQEKNFFDLMNTMFADGWITGEDLFLGAERCMQATLDKIATNAFVTGPFDSRKDSYRGSFWAPDIEIDSYHSAYVPYPLLDINTLETTCFSNLRVCTWNQTNNPALKNGFEFEAARGCGFAWPNVCIDGKGFGTTELNEQQSYAKFGTSDNLGLWFNGNTTAARNAVDPGTRIYLENQIGPAFILQEHVDIPYPYEYEYKYFGSVVSDPYPYSLPGGSRVLLGFNTQYDVLNNRLGVLQDQAKNPGKQCRELPQG